MYLRINSLIIMLMIVILINIMIIIFFFGSTISELIFYIFLLQFKIIY
jgi:hypothetical protein